MDSAQESVPCLYVNGDKFNFSDSVIQLGKLLFGTFLELHKKLRKFYLSANYDGQFLNVELIKNELKNVLEVFDSEWVAYEEVYVKELMVIEKQARKYITDAIEIDLKLLHLEEEWRREGRISAAQQLEIN